MKYCNSSKINYAYYTGDSGGPFICQSSPNEICGIVSYGEGCAKAGSPGTGKNMQWKCFLEKANDNKSFLFFEKRCI